MNYKITYEDGLIQYKKLISHSEYESIIKPMLLEKDGKKRVKMLYGESHEWFTDRSPLYDSITTDILKSPFPGGPDFKVKLEEVMPRLPQP